MKHKRLKSTNSIQLRSVTGGYLKFKAVFNKTKIIFNNYIYVLNAVLVYT